MVNVNDNPDDMSNGHCPWFWVRNHSENEVDDDTSLHSFLVTGAHTSLGTCSVTVRQTLIMIDKILIVMMVDYVGNGYDNVSYLLRSSLALLLGDLLALAPLELLALVLLVRHLKEQTRYTCSAQTTPCCILRDTAYCTMGLSRPTSTLNFFTFWSTHSVLGTVLHSEVRTSFGTFTFFFLATSLHSFKQQHWY